MRKYFFEILGVLLIGGSFVFFHQCIRFLAERDYIAAVMLMLIGIAVIKADVDVARLALVERPR